MKAAREGAIQRFREGTREERIKIADEARERFGKNLAWGAKAGDQTALFTHMAVPVMTRLRLPERLDRPPTSTPAIDSPLVSVPAEPA